MLKENRKRLSKIIKERYQNNYLPENSIILLKGSTSINVWDLDTTYCLKHESNFKYIFGCGLPNFYGFMNITTLETGLILPEAENEEDAIFNKFFDETDSDLKTRYELDVLVKTSNFKNYFKSKGYTNILISNGIEGEKSSISALDLITKLNLNCMIDNFFLYSALNESRVLKNNYEIEKMTEISQISSKAHIKVMQYIKPEMYEYELQSKFLENCLDVDEHAYEPICCSGINGSILHYEINNCIIGSNSFMLCDMGAKKDGYCSDITCSYPANGKFSKKQKEIYKICLLAHDKARDGLKAGILYSDIQDISFREILKGLIELKILKGSFDELYEKKVFRVFMMHSLGHYIGGRVHDTGIRKKKSNPSDINFENNEAYNAITVNTITQENMFTTIEPGIYFNDVSYKNHEDLHDYIDYDLFKVYQKELGGVRIEDVYLITADGYKEVSNCPRTPDQIEACMRKEDWTQYPRNNY